MRIPLSKISTGNTKGKEYVLKTSGNFYVGNFYKIYGTYYSGSNYNPDITPEELIPVKKKAIDNPNSFLYNVLAGAKAGLNARSVSTRPTKSAALASIAEANKQGFVPVVGVNPDADNEAMQSNANEVQTSSTPTEVKRYFFRKIIKMTKNGPEYKIGEMNEEEYNSKIKILILPTYVTAVVSETRIPGDPPYLNETELNAAEKKIPGLKQFLGITE
jgi:hypothetical protein